MKLSVATNWDSNLLKRLRDYPVHDVFGSLPTSIVGSGRPSFILPKVNRKQVEDHINLAHSLGIKFTYLLNAPCLGKLEYDKSFHLQLLKYIEWIVMIGADYITVSIPFLLELIKRQFPQLKIKVSVIANVNSVARLRFFEELGADVVTIDYMMNRNFELLKTMASTTSCELELLANDLCLYQCPYRGYHYNLVGHASQSSDLLKGFFVDYCLTRCTYQFLSDPTEYLKAPWIRPEDITLYEKIGLEYFKLSDRCKSTDWLVNVIKAYSTRNYKGNLMDLLNNPQPSIEKEVQSKNLMGDIARPDILKNLGFRNFFQAEHQLPIKPVIQNRMLDGFVDFFQKGCCAGECASCKYCALWAKKVISLKKRSTKSYLRILREIIKDLTTSKFAKGGNCSNF